MRPVNLESNLNGTPPKAIPGQKLSQALKQHHQLAFWYFPKNKIKGVHSQKTTKIPMAHLQESGRLSRSRCKLWIMSLVAFSYARNQKMGRCDLSTRSQIPMAHRQKPFQAKSLAKHWNSITSLRSGMPKRNKIKGVHSHESQNPNGTLASGVDDFHKQSLKLITLKSHPALL